MTVFKARSLGIRQNFSLRVCIGVSIIFMVLIFQVSGDFSQTAAAAEKAAEKAAEIPEFRVALSPGHGGKVERGREQTGDYWCEPLGKFLKGYFNGTSRDGKQEEKVVLDLAERIQKILQLTATESGWKQFSGILSRVTGSEADFQRVKLIVNLIRKESWDSPSMKSEKDVNSHFRLFDTPPEKRGEANFPGRLSAINDLSPHLVVALHLNTSGSQSWRGMHTVVTPSYSQFREIAEAAYSHGLQGISRLAPETAANWNFTGGDRNRFGWMANDASTYFYGFRPSRDLKKFSSRYIGHRHCMLSWPFSESWKKVMKVSKGKPVIPDFRPFSEFPDGLFWKRERSRFEERRRGWSLMGRGGDNLYAGTEVLRFVRLSLARGSSSGPLKKLKGSPDDIIGPILRPALSDWSEPMLINSVISYLELGHISNSRDFALLKDYPDLYAEGIAVGIYSLLAGIELKPEKKLSDPPWGRPIDWNFYEFGPGEAREFLGDLISSGGKKSSIPGNYFEIK